MNPANQAEAKLAAAPFDFRLSLIFVPTDARATQTALHAVYLELHEVPREARDPGVADVKLRWWEEEIACLYAGKPRHPLTQALTPYLAALAGRQALFLDLIAGTRMDIAGAGFPTFEDVKRYCFRQSGALAELSAVLAGALSEQTLLAARLLGNATCLAEIANGGIAAALQGRLYFAQEDLKRHGVDKHINGETHAQAPVLALVRDYGDRARAMADGAIETAPQAERHALRVWAVRHGLALKRLARQQSLGTLQIAEPVELHPLSALFTAWRSARQVSRGHRG